MTEMEIKTKMEELMANEEFNEKFKNANSASEIIELFKTVGIEVEEKNAQVALDYLKNSGELDEAALDDVNGGLALAIISGVALTAAYTGALGVAYACCLMTGKKKKKK